MSAPWNWRPAGPSLTRRPASLIRLEGSDALRVLHGQTSAAIEGARPGQWIPTCCITPTARMRALAEVLVDADGAWLAVTAGEGAQVHQALDRVLFPADRVRLLAPQPGWLVEPVPGETEQLETAEAGRWQDLESGGGWQLGQGRLGRALLLESDTPLPAAWAGRTTLGAAESERWRIQTGVPAVPGEINDDHNPFELGLADRVSLRKGCYVGQETLAKLATYDGVKQLLRRWHWQAEPGVPAPEAGQVLQESQTEAAAEATGAATAESASGDAAAGTGARLGVISSVLELGNGDRIGLALVRRRALEQPLLQAGSGWAAPLLQLSAPDGFVPPPVGPGAGQAAQAS